jgi:ABC-type sulfate/molybdate transport systems ATPase subunit
MQICVQTTVLVTHGVHHLPSADKVIIMEAGKVKHFGTFEQVRDAGATFALASTGGDADAGKNQVKEKQNATVATVIDEEKDEEEAWSAEQASRRGAYTFYAKCTGFLRTGILFVLITLWSGVGLFATAYLSSAWLLFSAARLLPHRLSQCSHPPPVAI